MAFSSVGSFDPDAQPLSYSWNFGDGSALSTQQNPTHVYTASGVYTATLTLTETTSPFATRSATVVITVGNEPPLAHITSPVDGSTYKIGDVITYAGFATSGGNPVDPSQLTWELRLHHNEHIHFNLLDPGAGGTFNVIQHGDNTHYEICLTATVNQTLTDTQCVNIFPQTTVITLSTDPVGLLVNYENEGLTQPSPLIAHPVVGSQDTVSVEPIQGGLTFSKWTDGQTSNAHDFLVGTTRGHVHGPVREPATGGGRVGQSAGRCALRCPFSSRVRDRPIPSSPRSRYGWDFGDGGNSTQADPTHTYTNPGTYTATLTVTDQQNGTATKSLTLIVTATGQCGNGQIDPGEACDGGPCCTGGCQFASAGAVCRPATGLCDVAETCTGSSATCPADVLAASGTLCRPAAGVCDVAETCTGSSPACPADVVVAAGTTCRPPASPCDIAEACTGSSTACPADVKAANGTSCSDGNACNGVETCQGGACSAGTPLACNDGNPCTDDSCDAATGCVFMNNTAPCSDGVACTNDLCTNGVCVSTSSCPVGQTCNSTTGACEVPAGGYTLWPTNPIPAIVDGGDPNAVQLGVKFRSDVAGFVTGMRFYKTTTNTGTHVGTLWSSAGAALATGTFSERIDVRMAAAELRDAGRDRREHRLRRLLLRTQRSLQREPRLLRAGPRHAAAPCPGRRGAGRQWRVRLRDGHDLPDGHVPVAQLLGGRRVHSPGDGDAHLDRGDAGEPVDRAGRDAAIHRHGDVLGLELAESHQPGDLDLVDHVGGDDHGHRTGDGNAPRARPPCRPHSASSVTAPRSPCCLREGSPSRRRRSRSAFSGRPTRRRWRPRGERHPTPGPSRAARCPRA